MLKCDTPTLLKDWHERLGHLNVHEIISLSREGRFGGLVIVSERVLESFECLSCIMGKKKELASPPYLACAPTPLEVVHLCHECHPRQRSLLIVTRLGLQIRPN